jgi:5-methyltetrahydropteroyltriglutamate--homocysteine methyltransferase
MTIHPDGRPPFRADHVGSLLRPAALRQAFRRHNAGEIGDPDFARIQDGCIRDAVRMQEEVGLRVVTDGEFRRPSYWARFAERVEGFGLRKSVLPFKDDNGDEVEFIAPYPTGTIRRTRALAVDEFAFLQQATGATPKITLPSPSTMHFFGGLNYGSGDFYGDLGQFFADLGRAYAEEIAELTRAGCRYIQIDEVAVVLLADPAIRETVTARGGDPDRLIDLYIDAINIAVGGKPPDAIVGVHICRGNYKGHYLGEAAYDPVAERVFARTEANHFLLEYDTPRAGGFTPLRLVPKGKGIVLGLVSSKSPELESLDQLKRRIEDAARHMELDRLAISPQCGFASTAAGNPVSEADQRAKLRRVVETAQAIWN